LRPADVLPAVEKVEILVASSHVYAVPAFTARGVRPTFTSIHYLHTLSDTHARRRSVRLLQLPFAVLRVETNQARAEVSRI
jgi:hypothetical protein